jgi:hypothetical protein
MSLNYPSNKNKGNKEDKLSQELHNLQSKYDEIKKRHNELIKRYRAIYKDNEQIKRQNEKLMAEIRFLKLPPGLKQFIKDLRVIKSPFDMRKKLEINRQ